MGGQGPPRWRASGGWPRGADAFAFLPRSTGGAPVALAGEAFTAKEETVRPADPEKIARHDRSGGTFRARRAREDRGGPRGRKAPGDDDAEIPDHVMQDFEESWGEKEGEET
jgi:hypothetical protein